MFGQEDVRLAADWSAQLADVAKLAVPSIDAEIEVAVMVVA